MIGFRLEIFTLGGFNFYQEGELISVHNYSVTLTLHTKRFITLILSKNNYYLTVKLIIEHNNFVDTFHVVNETKACMSSICVNLSTIAIHNGFAF